MLAPDQARTHLERLAEVLRRRNHKAELALDAAGDASLRVTNPAVPVMAESVVCRRASDQSWHFL
jgi:hypothetical protein